MPDYPLPSFLTSHADEHEPHDTLKQELQSTSGIFKASIFTVAVAVTGIALALSLGHPVRVLADATASLSDSSDLQRGVNQSPPAIQQAADARSSAPAAGGTLTREDMAVLAELTSQARAENNQPASGALLEQFQAWAARQDDAQAQESAQAEAEQPVQPVQAAPVQIARDDVAPEEPVQRHRTANSLRNARAEMPPVQKPKAKIQRKQATRRQAAPIQDARAVQQPVPNVQQPSFLQSLGWNQ
jgi:hypothetical protein